MKTVHIHIHDASMFGVKLPAAKRPAESVLNEYKKLSQAMEKLEKSGKTYEQVKKEYEALSSKRDALHVPMEYTKWW